MSEEAGDDSSSDSSSSLSSLSWHSLSQRFFYRPLQIRRRLLRLLVPLPLVLVLLVGFRVLLQPGAVGVLHTSELQGQCPPQSQWGQQPACPPRTAELHIHVHPPALPNQYTADTEQDQAWPAQAPVTTVVIVQPKEEGDGSDDELCVPSSASYPACLFPFHALVLANTASGVGASVGAGSSASGGSVSGGVRPRLPAPTGRDYSNRSVVPIVSVNIDAGPSRGSRDRDRDRGHDDGGFGAVVQHQRAGAGADDPDSLVGDWEPRVIVRPNRPNRPSGANANGNSGNGNNANGGGGNGNGGGSVVNDYYDGSDSYFYQTTFPSSFRESLLFFWPLVLFSMVISVCVSLVMLGWQRLGDDRRRAWEDARQNWGPKQWAQFRNQIKLNNKQQEKQALRKKNNAAAAAAAAFASDLDDFSDSELSSGGDSDSKDEAPPVAARVRRRRGKDRPQRQTSDPSSSSYAAAASASASASPPALAALAAGLTPNGSGTLIARKTHFGTYESNTASSQALLASGFQPSSSSVSGGSGESKLIRPRKHIQSRPDTAKLNSDAATSSLSPTLLRVFSHTHNNADGSVSIGSMLLFPHQVLGTGSMGTVVYAGTFEGRPCAIKRLVKPFFGSANAAQEIALLIQSDQHPNVLRYYAKEEDTSFVYLALEQCVGTIQDLVDSHAKVDASGSALPQQQQLEETIQILHGMMTGLAHLHQLHIVHRDVS